MDRRLATAFWALRIGLGLGAFLAGLDKFFNFLTDWAMYISPLATRVLPVSATTFMRCVGVIEMLVGLAILAGFSRIGAYVLMLWLIAISINLVATKLYYDLAVRDVEIALGAFALARLSEVRMLSSATGSSRATHA
ncbi:MAG TPA: hypothetical protein VNN08_12075 [Thermoanaerobaculia bacterium]|nr:hypothetical protein [Thermoanaerobaculia bacterium]